MNRLILVMLLLSGCATIRGEHDGCIEGDIAGFDDATEDLANCYRWDPDRGLGFGVFGIMMHSDAYTEGYEQQFEACYTETYVDVYPESLSGADCVPSEE